jgi:hypothetical protein
MTALLCPKCGGVLKWACSYDEGEAYCSALQSRVVPIGKGEEQRPLCNFVGKVRRISPSEVVLVTKKEKP